MQPDMTNKQNNRRNPQRHPAHNSMLHPTQIIPFALQRYESMLEAEAQETGVAITAVEEVGDLEHASADNPDGVDYCEAFSRSVQYLRERGGRLAGGRKGSGSIVGSFRTREKECAVCAFRGASIALRGKVRESDGGSGLEGVAFEFCGWWAPRVMGEDAG